MQARALLVTYVPAGHTCLAPKAGATLPAPTALQVLLPGVGAPVPGGQGAQARAALPLA